MTKLLQTLQTEVLYEGQPTEILLAYLRKLLPAEEVGELLALIKLLVDLSDKRPMETANLLEKTERSIQKAKQKSE
jgi:hypothetical protein